MLTLPLMVLAGLLAVTHRRQNHQPHHMLLGIATGLILAGTPFGHPLIGVLDHAVAAIWDAFWTALVTAFHSFGK